MANPTKLVAYLQRLDENPERLCQTFFDLCNNLAQQETTLELLFLTFGSTNRTFPPAFPPFSSLEGTRKRRAVTQTRRERTETALWVVPRHQETRERRH